MGFFDKFKEFQNQISEFENNIHNNKQDFLEIYERNIQLEKEIIERKKDLDIANQRMLTLHHIWEMMNSSRPLSSVLNTIVKMLQGDLGYLHSCIIKKKEDVEGDYLQIITQSTDEILNRLDNLIGKPIETLRLNYDENGFFAKSITEKNIVQTVDFRAGLRMVAPYFSEDLIRKILDSAKSRSIIIIPLYALNADFGWLVVFSQRDKAEEEELDFLKLFAQQIELAITIADLFQVVKNQALTDPLTTLYNRRFFEESLDKEFIRAKRTHQPFTIIALDLDYLKQINDKHGHSFGDIAIKTVADVLKKNARSIDVAARIGGEEFNLLLPGVDSCGGLIAAERIRSAISECKLVKIGQITASIGVVTFPEHSTNLDELIELVDQAMYKAKRNGRNQVQLAKVISEISWQEVAMDTFTEILNKHKIYVSEELSTDIMERLSKKSNDDTLLPKENLYSIADMLAQTYNPQHSKGVTKSKVQMAIKLAKLFELPEEEINKLRIAVLLYDVGNLMLPPELLQKSEPLSEEEKDKIKQHPVIAAREILKPISQIDDVIPIIEYHHENWDGSGYPGKVSGEEIPLASQIILIIDAFFAMTEPRAYRDALSTSKALEQIKNESGKKWNPNLVKEFVNLIEKSYKK